MLFLGVQQDSVLWLAVRAVAFADTRNESTGNVSFHTKSRQHYGAALNRMRTVINDQQSLGDDRILFSMLLIDNFEVFYSPNVCRTPLISLDNTTVDVSRSKFSFQSAWRGHQTYLAL